METKMLRLPTGVTRMDHIRNDAIRQKFGVSRARCAKVAHNGNWKAAYKRPKQRWSDTLHMDLKVVGIHSDLAVDLERWRHDTRIADPATKRNRR
ncbi:unnamed protein product [Heligmosomoides polygyrus]|uniref:HTH_Tnp_Tc3_2 domain-containing protein n=1 Tax=Heligmosomoides polygyrus TaxID=6339 RepID=A0A183F495_HELPZ|nr:unnamed protein product [Heligmosomoides polygyrus]